jgi:hypothetical protein
MNILYNVNFLKIISVDVLDQINNHGKPMEEYSFWTGKIPGHCPFNFYELISPLHTQIFNTGFT